MKHIAFPSIDQFRNAIRHVRDNAEYHFVPVPTVVFNGTVKLHGTNAAICIDSDDVVWFQSRERIISPLSDNAGFAIWASGKMEFFARLFSIVRTKSNATDVQLYGEWCGGNIQRGVGISLVPKMFVVFGIQLGFEGKWLSVEELNDVFYGLNEDGVYHSQQFKTYTVTINMSSPESVQNELIRITNEVEERCPVAEHFLGNIDKNLIGEGVVWTAVETIDSTLNFDNLRFKVKGEKHSVSKVKTIAEVDVEKLNSINEFVESTVTENRLEQGLDKLQEKGLDIDPKNTGEYIKWIVSDVLKEELDTLSRNGWTTKDVTGRIASEARQFFMSRVVLLS